jgi:hypothetical protein
MSPAFAIQNAEVIEGLRRRRQSVHLVAAGFTPAAADAAGGVEKDARAIGVAFKMSNPGGLGRFGKGSTCGCGTQQA